MLSRPSQSWILFFAFTVYYAYKKVFQQRRRALIVPQNEERVLVIGASSGIGREIAQRYSSRGAKVCIVGRRKDKIEAVADGCKSELGAELGGRSVLSVPADFSNAKDMVHVRSVLEKEWGGIDTVIVAAGVSALRPLLQVAGVDSHNSDASEQGVQAVINAAEAASKSNYVGPTVSAVTLIPMLQRTSKSPSILLVSSLGAVIPAPTRSIYGSTKSASLLLYQALSIEHPSINFSFVLPSTVQGDFRASAVDVPPVNANENSSTPQSTITSGLKIEYVARRCVQAADESRKVVFLPEVMGIGHLLYWLWPSFVEKRAMKKYGFTAN
ncbi:hypothetical protein D9757_009529 [Collybiopsis confluens]|uniref:NAD(P)-binding protein n=1 Tax=Collybiopsis confluens TaxID=2823264 RepID=A0A8H5H8J1_9AGAR|nr:hypothetical protein D9757_009529 [Collybiopsis confluens]